jgi:hypothetical protein
MIALKHWGLALTLLIRLTACPNDPPPQPINHAPTAAFSSLETVQAEPLWRSMPASLERS